MTVFMWRDLSLGMGTIVTAAPDGNSTSPSWCFTAKSTARCCSFKGKRLIVNSTSNFILLIKVCNNLKCVKRRETRELVSLSCVHISQVSLLLPTPVLTFLRSPASPYPALPCGRIQCTQWWAGLCPQIWTPSDNLLEVQMADSQRHQEPVGSGIIDIISPVFAWCFTSL